MAIVFALLPAALATTGMPEPVIWKIGSGGLLAWYIGIVPYRITQSRRLGVRSALPRALKMWVLAPAVLQIYNLTTSGLLWPYLFGIFSLVVNGFSVFLLLLLGTGSESKTLPASPSAGDSQITHNLFGRLK